MYNFDYVRAKSVQEVNELFSKNPEARFISGGMTLLPTLKQRLANPALLIDLQDLPEMRGITVDEKMVSVGAMTRHADVAAHKEIAQAIPALAFLASGIADPQVRNMGTIGGSISNNDPSADYPGAVLGLGAKVITNKRTIDADDFFTGLFSTALEKGEFVMRVNFPRVLKAGYCKMPNPASGYVMAGCFVSQTMDKKIRVAINGAGPCVFRQREFEKLLESDFSVNAINACVQSAEGLNADMHASAAYRAQLVVYALKRAIEFAQSH
ncbi:xanthine dehydrogenase family protein subunit M [Advenella alkanexedens]|uniref:Xanthine dehydrogenase family protein subunit M n=1 Tax=Advenella alkanexedens TaxID=1481665 RepID=A0ABS6NJG8_9BURK|nr:MULTISPECIES: xanthine dehydrogenase family protein subunit M [Advenella]MBV4395780.1 xanthine dehydrogenase family protein subunit M [Advenella alkanexedens]MDD3757430.1 xanthine dehydrogenase family protein subunit M [Advenella sp.]